MEVQYLINTLKGQGPGLVNVLFAKRKSDYTRGCNVCSLERFSAAAPRIEHDRAYYHTI